MKREEFERAFVDKIIILQKSSTFQLYIFIALMLNTIKFFLAQEKLKHDDLIERYIFVEKLLNSASTLYKDASE